MNSFKLNEPFLLESGQQIENLTITFNTYGALNEAKDNVIWVCHALTANSDVLDWWNGLFGEEKFFDPKEYFIVCANVIGSCYGTTGPITPRNGRLPLLDAFPLVTTKDQAKAHDLLLAHLKIERVKLLIGASLGGQQALEWSIINPNLFENLVLIATNAQHSAYGIAFNESQRLAIKADRTFGNGNIKGGKEGLVAARSIAMLSYRSYEGYVSTQSESNSDKLDEFKASSYQKYQGVKLANRFSAYAYTLLSKTMDSHCVGRGRDSIASALQKVRAKTLVIGISTDSLFPTQEQKFLAHGIPSADYAEIHSDFGHDGFLIETEQLHDLLEDFLDNNLKNYRPTVFKSTIKKNQLMNLVEYKTFQPQNV